MIPMAVDSHIFDISRTIQLAVAPVFLLTAIGTIINVLIGRLGRAVDRRRLLEEHLSEYSEEMRADALRELSMLPLIYAFVKSRMASKGAGA